MRLMHRLLKRRAGIGERAPYVLMFMVLFQLSAGAVNTLGMFNYSLAVNNTPYDPGAVGSVIQCTSYTVGTNQAQCSPGIGAAQTQPNILVFGDWFRALTMIYAFFSGVFLPGYFLIQFGYPVVWAALFTGGFYFAWLFLIMWMISGRPV